MKIVTFGCRMNTFESAVMSRLGKNLDDHVIVVNTCAVTGEAERQCRQTIRKLKRENPQSCLIVTGCAAQLNPNVYAQMPEVDRVLGNIEKLTPEILLGQQKCVVGDIDAPYHLPLVMDFEGRCRAFLQIQQGCDHHCTFCIVRVARGRNRGLPIDQVLKQAEIFMNQGYQELVLTGADVASYPYGLTRLVRCLLNQFPQIQRLRFGSLDPAKIDDDFVALVRDYPQIMPHFHLSIQSGDNQVLKRMGRRHRAEDVIRLAQNLRQVRPDIVLGADFITGFAGETEQQFQHTLDLVRQAYLTHLHVFPYSERPGTPAVKLKQIDVATRRLRAHTLRQLGQEQYQALLQTMIGQTVSVLVEDGQSGWTENYLRVILSKPVAEGKIISVQIQGVQNDALVG